MTLLVALTGKNGLVLAADSRGTFGDPRMVTAQNDAQQKAHILSSHVAVLTAGSGEVGSMVLDQVTKEVDTSHSDWASPVVDTLRSVSRKQYGEWFPSVPPIQPAMLIQAGQVASRPDVAFLVGGYEQDGTPRLISLISALDFAPLLHNYGFAVQGVAQYALYLLNRLYQSDRTIEELTALAVYVITETASQDGKVGGPVKVITINPDSVGCKTLSPADVISVQEDNAARSQTLRNSFYAQKVVTK
jgi:20S proteasome alpha/beta subunit